MRRDPAGIFSGYLVEALCQKLDLANETRTRRDGHGSASEADFARKPEATASRGDVLAVEPKGVGRVSEGVANVPKRPQIDMRSGPNELERERRVDPC